MATKYDWPAQQDRSLIGKRLDRRDGPAKASGKAKYAYDRNPAGLLFAQLVCSPHAHARITRIDASGAEQTPGVRGVVLIKDVGAEVQWVGSEIAAIAADSEDIARDAARKFKIEYEVLPHLVKEEDLNNAGDRVTKGQDNTTGDPDTAWREADVKHEGYYGVSTINHCCMEPHGQTVDWKSDDEILVYASTQAVGRIGADLAKNLSAAPGYGKISPGAVRVITPYMGG